MSAVFITGGSRGIGKATVQKFAAQGYDVAYTYLSHGDAAMALAKELSARYPNSKFLPLQADIASRADCVAAYEEAKRQLGFISVLVNNAGIAHSSLFQDVTEADWQRIIGVNLTGAFYLCQLAARDMIAAQEGSIVNISSVWGELGASMEVAYSAAKAGLIGMTKALAKELGPSGIRVNCITPGVIDTDMNASHSAETLAELADSTALCRIGTADEVANAVYFLASEQASFITGQVLGVNGQFPV